MPRPASSPFGPNPRLYAGFAGCALRLRAAAAATAPAMRPPPAGARPGRRQRRQDPHRCRLVCPRRALATLGRQQLQRHRPCGRRLQELDQVAGTAGRIHPAAASRVRAVRWPLSGASSCTGAGHTAAACRSSTRSTPSPADPHRCRLAWPAPGAGRSRAQQLQRRRPCGRRLQELDQVAGNAGRSTPLPPRVASAWRRPLSRAAAATAPAVRPPPAGARPGRRRRRQDPRRCRLACPRQALATLGRQQLQPAMRPPPAGARPGRRHRRRSTLLPPRVPAPGAGHSRAPAAATAPAMRPPPAGLCALSHRLPTAAHGPCDPRSVFGPGWQRGDVAALAVDKPWTSAIATRAVATACRRVHLANCSPNRPPPAGVDVLDVSPGVDLARWPRRGAIAGLQAGRTGNARPALRRRPAAAAAGAVAPAGSSACPALPLCDRLGADRYGCAGTRTWWCWWWPPSRIQPRASGAQRR
ncbi:hypothetical protein LMG31884_46640 (plasmid) [Xanthomonas hydrangeae]|nr:hypothetical protein LMG31884_46640 [Xanthomonas hydrangeae]CAD7740421.1 hypothetical protein LMG31884_46640 [Xanthomonas hydrangeae]